MKAATKRTIATAKKVAFIVARNWRIATIAVGIVSASAAQYMGQLGPLVDAISQVQL